MRDFIEVIKMNNLLVHLKYSLKIFRYFFAVIIIISAVFSIIYAISQGSYYHDWYIHYVTNSPAIDPEVVNLMRAGATISYWRDFILYMSFIIPPVIAFFISRDEENGMNGLLIMHSKKGSLFISRLIVIVVTLFIVSLLAGIIFNLSFYQINGIILNQLLPECLGVFLILTSYALIGAFVGFIIPRKEWSIIISVFIVIFLNTLSNLGISEGDAYMGNIEGPITWNEYLSLYPLKWKILKFTSPWGLIEILNPLAGIPQGIIDPNPIDVSLLGLTGDIFLSLAWIILLSFFSYILFLRKHRNSLEVIL